MAEKGLTQADFVGYLAAVLIGVSLIVAIVFAVHPLLN